MIYSPYSPVHRKTIYLGFQPIIYISIARSSHYTKRPFKRPYQKLSVIPDIILFFSRQNIICYNNRKGEFQHEKILSLLFFTLAAFIFISCFSQDNLDCDYYWLDTENSLRNELSFSIKGNEGSIEKGAFGIFTVDTKNNTFELFVEDASSKEVLYKHSDRVIPLDISGTKHKYYKNCTDAYEKADKKYNELQN